MGFSVADQYYLKAENNYPYEMDKVVEQLLYALSSDNEHCQSNCLMGKVYMYQMKQYDKAEHYFNQSIQADMSYPEAFLHLSLLKIWQREYDKATKIIS